MHVHASHARAMDMVRGTALAAAAQPLGQPQPQPWFTGVSPYVTGVNAMPPVSVIPGLHLLNLSRQVLLCCGLVPQV
jgi:hypothetical protein